MEKCTVCGCCEHYLDRNAEPGDGLCREDIFKNEKFNYAKLVPMKKTSPICSRFNKKEGCECG